MKGILKIAYKLLVNDKGKFAALLVGITFAVFLMIMMTSMFAGMLHRSSATVLNVGAKLWVMDPAVNTPANSIPMPDYVLSAVRSINGVKYAVPLYSGGALVKLRSGVYQAVTVLGLDDSSLYGRPELIEGEIDDIYAENAFIVVKDAEFYKLENPQVGTEFEINDHRGVIVGIAKVASSGLFGVPTLYTTYNRAITYIPSMRFTAAFILVDPKSSDAVPYIKQQVGKLGYVALTKDEFIAEDFRFLQIPDGYGHQCAHHDGDKFHRRPIYFRPDILYLHPGEPGKIRRFKSNRSKRERTGLYDPVPGDIYVSYRLWPGYRPRLPHDHDRKTQTAPLRSQNNVLEISVSPLSWS